MTTNEPTATPSSTTAAAGQPAGDTVFDAPQIVLVWGITPGGPADGFLLFNEGGTGDDPEAMPQLVTFRTAGSRPGVKFDHVGQMSIAITIPGGEVRFPSRDLANVIIIKIAELPTGDFAAIGGATVWVSQGEIHNARPLVSHLLIDNEHTEVTVTTEEGRPRAASFVIFRRGDGPVTVIRLDQPVIGDNDGLLAFLQAKLDAIPS